MANDLFFSRNTRVIVSDGTIAWEIPVLDGFSFSQATNASEITLNEMSSVAGSSRRGRKMFNDSYAPAEWSFSTYARPFKGTPASTDGWEDTGSDANVHAVEEALWAGLVGKADFTASSGATEAAWSDNIVNSTTTCTIDFLGSNSTTLKTYDIYFVMGEGSTPADGTHNMYKLAGSVVNSAGIDFDIDGIATINWAGFASLVTQVAASDLPSTIIKEAISATNNFIRNRLTTLTSTGNTADGFIQAAYTLTLTGGSLNFENNITYLTPETLGVVNQPIGHVTGTRNIGGSFTCYLSNTSAGSGDLFEDLIESNSVVTNNFNLVFDIGGSANPTMQVTLPNCHLEVPTHSIEDVISLEVNFHALSSTLNLADEATIVYKGNTV